MGDVVFRFGIPEEMRYPAAELYDDAFGAKLGAAIRDRGARVGVLAEGMNLTRGFAAVHDGTLLGLAGIHNRDGSLTGDITFRLLRRRLGILRSIRAIAVLALLSRRPIPNELLMDGIVVRADARGRGIGSGLFAALESYCADAGLHAIRLDVVDTNPAAKRLYERLGFTATKVERVPFLRPIMGFGASTTMVKRLVTSNE